MWVIVGVVVVVVIVVVLVAIGRRRRRGRSGVRTGPTGPDVSKAELYKEAQDLDISGRSSMTKAELADAVEEKRAEE